MRSLRSCSPTSSDRPSNFLRSAISAWRNLLDSHDVIARTVVEQHSGRLIKTTGDGILATFDGPGRAIRCALALRDALRPLGLEIHAGLHTGEVELRGEDIAGIAVHIAARVLDAAAAGELLVSAAVPMLVAGAGFEFDDRGHHELKGIDGTWQLLAVKNLTQGQHITADQVLSRAADRRRSEDQHITSFDRVGSIGRCVALKTYGAVCQRTRVSAHTRRILPTMYFRDIEEWAAFGAIADALVTHLADQGFVTSPSDLEDLYRDWRLVRGHPPEWYLRRADARDVLANDTPPIPPARRAGPAMTQRLTEDSRIRRSAPQSMTESSAA